jgi:predicted nucleic acid-binding protein
VILPDSSAWIEYLRASGSPVHQAMRELVHNPSRLAVTEPVVMEVLAGSRSEQQLATYRGALLDLRLLPIDGLAGFEEAALIFRRCRSAGETLRSLVDCMVAVPALRAGASVLHQDRDFDAIARHTDLRVVAIGR